MATNDELEPRVSALEREVRVIRQDAAAARVLAGGADRDVSAMNAKLDMHKALLGALRETQIGQGQRIDSMDEKIDSMGQRIEVLDEKVDSLEQEMRRGFSMMSVGLAELLALNRPDDAPPQD